MAAAHDSSVTLDLQDFIPYPLKILHIKDFVAQNSSRVGASVGPGGGGGGDPTNSSISECPFDCCQKKLQQVYFPDCELTNATIKMKIGSGGDLTGKVGGIPCLERRTIYEGRVTDLPVKFEDLLKEAGAAQGEDIVVDRNNSSNLHSLHQNPHQPSAGKESGGTLRLTFHQQQQHQQQVAYSRAVAAAAAANSYGGSPHGKDVNRSGRQGTSGSNGDPQNQYHYMWDSSKSGWTWTKTSTPGPSSSGGERYSSSGYVPSVQQTHQSQHEAWNAQQQYGGEGGMLISDPTGGSGRVVGANEYWDKRDVEHMHGLWLKQQQLHSQPTPRLRKQPSATATSSSLLGREGYFDQDLSKGRLSSTGESFASPHGIHGTHSGSSDTHSVDLQLSSYLKSYKYMKPSAPHGYTGTHIAGSITQGSPMISPGNKTSMQNNTKTGQLRSRPVHQQISPQQETLNLKRPISPRTALVQFERLKKYWDYQHQLLEADDFTQPTGSSGERSLQGSYGGHTPAKHSRSSSSAYVPQEMGVDVRGGYVVPGGGLNSTLSPASQSAPPSLPPAHSYSSTSNLHAQSLHGASTSGSLPWGGPHGRGGSPYGVKGITGNTWGPSGNTISPPPTATPSPSSSTTTHCNWSVSVTELSPQSITHYKQTMAGSHESHPTTLVSKERLLNFSRSASASSVSLGTSKKEVCKAIASADVSNLYCTTINRVPTRDQRTQEKGTTNVLDPFEYDKAVLIGPLSHETSEDVLGICGGKSALELSKLAKKHERAEELEKLLESREGLNKPVMCEDLNVPRDMTIPRRSHSDDGVIRKAPSAADTLGRKCLLRKEIDEGIPRRNSDDPVTMEKKMETVSSLLQDLPERSKSTPGSTHETVYDHIVLLDKRVKTYMCKRCLETLKSEQEIRNHLFCKMLSNTIQCHVCRHLFSSTEYPEHLKMHSVNAKQ